MGREAGVGEVRDDEGGINSKRDAGRVVPEGEDGSKKLGGYKNGIDGRVIMRGLYLDDEERVQQTSRHAETKSQIFSYCLSIRGWW